MQRKMKGVTIAHAVPQPRRLEIKNAGIEIENMLIPAAIPVTVPVNGPTIANIQTSVPPNDATIAGAKR